MIAAGRSRILLAAVLALLSERSGGSVVAASDTAPAPDVKAMLAAMAGGEAPQADEAAAALRTVVEERGIDFVLPAVREHLGESSDAWQWLAGNPPWPVHSRDLQLWAIGQAVKPSFRVHHETIAALRRGGLNAAQAAASETSAKGPAEIPFLFGLLYDGTALRWARSMHEFGRPTNPGSEVLSALHRLWPLSQEPSLALMHGPHAARVRHAAISVQFRRGNARAVGPLLAIVDAPGEEEYWSHALETLGAIGDARAIGPIVGVLQTPSRSKYWHSAIRALGDIGDPWAVDALVEILQSANAEEWGAAASYALGKIRDPRAVEPLISVLGEWRQRELSEAAARTLGELGDRRAVPHVLARLTGEDWRLDQELVEVLDQLESPPASGAPLALYLVHRHKLDELRALGSDAVPALHAALRQKRERLADQTALARVLFDVADAHAVDALIWVMRNGLPLSLQEQARTELIRVGPPACEALSRELIVGPLLDPEDAGGIYAMLDQIGLEHLSSMGRVRVSIHERKWDEVKAAGGAGAEPLIEFWPKVSGLPWLRKLMPAVADALAATGDPRGVAPLLATLTTPATFSVSDLACVEAALVRLRGAAVEPLLERLRHDAPSEARRSIVKVLGEVGDPRAIEPLFEWLPRDVGALAALRKLGPAVIPVATARLRDDDQEVRRSAATVLEWMQAVPASGADRAWYAYSSDKRDLFTVMQAEAIEPLVRLLDSDPGFAAAQLARIEDRRAVAPLTAKLTQADGINRETREAVARALKQLNAVPAGGAERAWYELVRPKPDWRLVQSLGAEALPALRWSANDGIPKHRGKSTQLLARLTR